MISSFNVNWEDYRSIADDEILEQGDLMEMDKLRCFPVHKIDFGKIPTNFPEYCKFYRLKEQS